MNAHWCLFTCMCACIYFCVYIIQLPTLKVGDWSSTQEHMYLHQFTLHSFNVFIPLFLSLSVPTLISCLLLQHPKPTPCRRTPVSWGSRTPATTPSQDPILIRCCNRHIQYLIVSGLLHFFLVFANFSNWAFLAIVEAYKQVVTNKCQLP